MNELKWWKKSGLVQPEALICKCKKEGVLEGTSNWHDGTGILYMSCKCGEKWNARWVENSDPLSNFKGLSNERREDMLVGALEGGSNYWYMLGDLSEIKEYAEGEPTAIRIMKAVIDGKKFSVLDAENPKDILGVFGMESIIKGEWLMTTKHPKHWADIIEENDDADTADVWFQLCVMGKIVFG